MVLVVVISLLSWNHLSGRPGATADTTCAGPPLAVSVAADPAVADALHGLASRWTATGPRVGNSCVQLDVKAIQPGAVLVGLTGSWDTTTLGDRPAAWVPDSMVWVNRLTARDSALISGVPQSIATSPVVLAMTEQAGATIRRGNTLMWGDLPDAGNDPRAWAGYQQPSWGAMRVALPDPATNSASALALQSVVASADIQDGGAVPVTTTLLNTPEAQRRITALADAAPTGVPTTTRDAMIALAGGPGGTGATAAGAKAGRGDLPYSGVPVLEIDLLRRNLGLDGAPKPGAVLVETVLGGSTPVADFPLITLGGLPAVPAQAEAVRQFATFLATDQAQHDLARSGLRELTTNERPTNAPGIRWTPTQGDLTTADPATTQQIAATWASRSGGGEVATMVLDTSPSMDATFSGQSTLNRATAALDGQIGRFGVSSMGLWRAGTSDGAQYRELVATAPVSQSGGFLHAALTAVRIGPESTVYPAVLAAYRSAGQHRQAGRLNRVVLITEGSADSATAGDGLRTQLGMLYDPARPVRLDALLVGGSADDRSALQRAAAVTGGTLSQVMPGADLEAALGELLSDQAT
jgi:hypothetical protein